MEIYPEFTEIDGEEYKINTDYRYALQCFKIINDNTISDIERTIAIISVLFGKEAKNGEIINIPNNLEVALEKATIFLTCGKEKDIKETKKDMDFEYDKEYIVASFMSDYNIDISNTNMHFWKFCTLISGLTEDSILNRIRDLRNTDLSEYKDEKIKNKIKEAIERVALPDSNEYDEEDLEAIENFNRLLKEN